MRIDLCEYANGFGLSKAKDKIALLQRVKFVLFSDAGFFHRGYADVNEEYDLYDIREHCIAHVGVTNMITFLPERATVLMPYR